NKVSLWRWDGRKLLEETMTASKVEELLGLRYARQALQINPTHQPAQVVMLSLLADKGHQAPSADHPLGVLRPTVEDLLLTLNADLLNATLEQALRDERTTVIVSTLRALGKLGDSRALKPQAQGEPAVVRALYFGDPRVNFAAADALLRIPGAGTTAANARIVQVLKAALLPEPVAAARPRVLVASAQERLLLDLRRAAEGAGYDPVLVASGRQALRRLLERSDVGAVVIDSTLPDPGLSSLLAQLRADPALKRLPVLVAAVPDGPDTRLVLEQLEDVRIK